MTLRLSLYLSVLFSGGIFGFFYAWVCSTIWGLDMLPPEAAIKAMNAMNASVRNPVFFPAFFLTPLVLAISALLAWKASLKRMAWLLSAAVLVYMAGAFVPTASINVPMNIALAEAVYSDQTVAQIWQDYSSNWQIWNQIRTFMAGISLLLVTTALLSVGFQPNQTQSG